MRFIFLSNLAVCCVFLAGCAKQDVSLVLKECQELEAQNDRESWRKIAAKLENLYNDRRITDKTANVEAFRNFYVRSLIRTADGDYTKAARVATTVQEKHKTNFLANYQLGYIRLAQGSPNEAYPFLEEAHRQRPDNVNVLTQLLKAAEQTSDPGAGRYFEAASELKEFNKTPVFYNQWGLWTIEQGKNDLDSKRYYLNALKIFAKGYGLDNKNPQICLNMAILWDRYLKNPKAAQKYYVAFKRTLASNEEMNTRQYHMLVQQRLRDLSRQ